jgi:hypothetical protein
LGLDPDIVPQQLCRLLQRLCRHEGVRNPSWAGGDSNQALAGCRRCDGWRFGRRRNGFGIGYRRRGNRKLGQCRFNDRARIAYGLAGPSFVNRFTRKAGHIDANVAGQQDDVGFGNVWFGERVSGSDGALGLDRDPVPDRLGGLLQSFGRHKGVRDSGGAGRYRDDTFHFQLSRFRPSPYFDNLRYLSLVVKKIMLILFLGQELLKLIAISFDYGYRKLRSWLFCPGTQVCLCCKIRRFRQRKMPAGRVRE